MTTSHGGERWQNPPPYGPYGLGGTQVGEFAFRLRERLSEPDKEMPFAPGETPRWNRNDRGEFGALMDLETSLPMLERDDAVQGRDVHELFPNLRGFHDMLPFSDDERRWLVAGDRDLYGLWDTPSDPEEGVLVDVGIIATGERDGMAGGDMVRRWAAWRREVDEFAGRAILSQTDSFLKLLGRDLVHEQGWPESAR
jgi:hypothetical protein